MTVTFIGHADAPDNIRKNLKDAIIDLIENESADTFYIGTHGSFDTMSYSVLKELSLIYPHIKAFSVLAYMPTSAKQFSNMSNTTLPCSEVCALAQVKLSLPLCRKQNFTIRRITSLTE